MLLVQVQDVLEAFVYKCNFFVGKWVFVRFVLSRSVVLLWVEVLEVVYLIFSHGTTAHIKLCPPLY
jgi:hypothetical protein